MSVVPSTAFVGRAVAALVAAVLATGAQVFAGVIHVPADAPTIQQAIDVAQQGDTILVAPGTYTEAIQFDLEGVVVQSTGGPDVTIIDAGGAGPTVTVDFFGPFAGKALRGFTLTGGSGRSFRPLGEPTGLAGGGVFVASSGTLELSDCIITGNSVTSPTLGTWGGGVLVAGASQVTLIHCVVAGNSAGTGGSALHVEPDGCTLVAQDCSFTGNVTGSGAAAVELLKCSGSLTDCSITANSGDGVSRTWYGLSLLRCTFEGNTGWGYRHSGPGGADVTDCTFLGNGLGGAELMTSAGGKIPFGDHFVRRCIFAGDSLVAYFVTSGNAIESCSFDGATLDSESATKLKNCILRDTVVIPGVGSAALQYRYCDVEGGASGPGNIDADPLWADPVAHDYHLLPGSPCINTGDPASPLDADGSHADMGAVPYEPWSDLGGGVTGTSGLPRLEGDGPLVGGQPVTLTLSGVTPRTATIWLVGTSALEAPFKGGTLWPAALLLLPGVVTDGTGTIALSASWPVGVPPGQTIWAQTWFVDAAGPQGWAGSNGLRGTTP